MSLLIVDDHAAYRSFARSMLSAEGFEVAGEAGDGEWALIAAEELQPDVVLVDVNLPTINGFEVAQRLCEAPGHPQVVLISSRPATDFGTRLDSTPAVGFIPKHELSGAALSKLVS